MTSDSRSTTGCGSVRCAVATCARRNSNSPSRYAPLLLVTPRYAPSRAVTHQVRETLLQSPSWLFSAESDAKIPVVPTQPNNKRRSPGRAAAELWGAHPAPAVLVHFVCAAWPGSGGRQAAMELWGKWYAADIWQQLRSGEPNTLRTRALSSSLDESP